MTKHKNTSLISIIITVAMLAVTVLFIFGESLGLTAAHTQPAYAGSLFSTDRVHTIDIVISEDDWQDMLDNATAEEYYLANVVIDGNAVKNVGLRTKGNSSLSSIASSDSDRYSFKVEFDHYIGSQTYKGLDKLALNNIAQDNTYLKDYTVYQMMAEFGVATPLCSFIYITVNGEDWGLYLAVEAVEESFASRNYGSDYSGQLYKPDSLDMNMGAAGGIEENGEMPQMPEGDFEGGFGGENGEWTMPEGFDPESFDTEDFDPESFAGFGGFDNASPGETGGIEFAGGFGDSSDVSLIYTDDEHESYSNIFDNAKFNPTDEDKDRLIASLKQLNEGEALDQVVDTESVLRYFVVHTFVLNSDSYTGSMVHNYYLYEDDGVLSMIPWDYNLAYGGMSGGSDGATSLVNSPIDTPVTGGDMEDRPLINELLTNETYLERYHELYAEFLNYFDSGAFAEMYDNAVSLISTYVENDPTAFCTYDEFQAAQETLYEFCLLRAESVRAQLNGSISATTDGQSASENAGFIDASHIDISTMGSNSMGFDRGNGGERPGGFWQGGGDLSESGEENAESSTEGGTDAESGSFEPGEAPSGGSPPDGMQPPSGGQMPESGGQMP